MHPVNAFGERVGIVNVAGIVGQHAEVVVFLMVHIPFGIIVFAFDLCPAVTAAVAGVALCAADRLADIGKRRAVAKAVALAVDKNIVGIEHRPVDLGVGRIMTHALEIVVLSPSKQARSFSSRLMEVFVHFATACSAR